MIGWSAIAPVIKTLFGNLAQDRSLVVEPVDGDGGTRSFEAEWAEGPGSAIHDVQRFALLLKVTTIAPYGLDELRNEYVDPNSTAPADADYLGQLRGTVVGWRKLTIQVKAISVDRTDEVWCMAPLERLRAGLRRQSSIDALLAVGVTLIGTENAVKTNFKDGARWMSAAVMSVNLCAVFNDVDPAPNSWIERIHYDSHIQDGSGTELPSPPNVTGHAVPPDPPEPPPDP